MLDRKFLRENLQFVAEKCAQRGVEVDLNLFKEIDEKLREVVAQNDALKRERNVLSDKIGERKRQKEDVSELMAKVKEISKKIRELDDIQSSLERELREVMLTIPNIPHHTVKPGRGEGDNPVVRYWGEKPEFSFTPRPHWELGEELDILDFPRGAKIAGARFTLLKGAAAKMERALINFMLDLHTREHGYKEVMPPFIANAESMTGTGNLPKFKEDLFKIEGLDYYLVPTAEVPVTNIYRGETLDEASLPIYYAAYTPCFRAEAGSYGKDTRGLIRQHQFNKVELVKFTTPETSYDELEKLLADAEEVLKRLNIHYRVVSLCTGDLGFSASKTYDIEVWLPGQNAYREISSCSNFEDFQARRASIRYRPSGKKGSTFVHTLNGSGLAVGRTLVAIIENYQQVDGSIVIPEALRPYMHGMEVINKENANS